MEKTRVVINLSCMPIMKTELYSPFKAEANCIFTY